MRILITGGTGLIGRALCRALAADGHALTVLSRRPDTVATLCGAGVTALASLDAWTQDLAFDAVINLAGEPIAGGRWTPARKQRLWESRVGLTAALAGRIASARSKPGVLLSGSAIGYYGDRGDTELDESAPAADDMLGRLCVAWEQAIRPATEVGVRTCYLRTGLVLSRDGGLLARLRLPFALGLGGRLGSGRQWMSWIHIDDYVSIVRLLLAATDASGAFNLTAPCPATNADFTAAMAQALHRPAFMTVPAWVLRAVLGEMSVMLLGGQKVLPGRMAALGFGFAYPALAPALAALLGPTSGRRTAPA